MSALPWQRIRFMSAAAIPLADQDSDSPAQYFQNNLPLCRPNLALVIGERTSAVTKSESSTTAGICRAGGFCARKANKPLTTVAQRAQVERKTK